MLPRRAEGRRPHQADRPRPQNRPLPAIHPRHRPAGGPGSTSTGQGSDQAGGIPGATGPGPAGTWQGSGSGGPGKPALTWWSGQDAIDAEAATDGWYALLTNLDASITAAEVLLRYKATKPWNAATAT